MKKFILIFAILSVMFMFCAPAFAGGQPEISGETQQIKEDDKWWDGAGVWISGYAGHANQREMVSNNAYQVNEVENAVGFDKVITPHVRWGASFGYGFADINYKIRYTGYGVSSNSRNAFEGALTLTYDSIDLCESRKNGKYSPEAVRNQGLNGWYVDSEFNFTHYTYQYRYEVEDSTSALWTAKSHYNGQEYALSATAGYIYNLGKDKSIHVTPYTSIDWGYFHYNTSRVKGLGTGDYKGQVDESNDVQQGFGLKLAKSLASKKMGTFIPFVKGEWDVAYLRDWQSHDVQRFGGLFGAGVIFLSKGHATLSAGWDMSVQNRYLDNYGYWKLRYDL